MWETIVETIFKLNRYLWSKKYKIDGMATTISRLVTYRKLVDEPD
jgi:hypothetical protein